MKLASITAAAVAALVMTAALSTPADACRWKKAGYHGYRTADAGGEVRHWKHRKHWKHRRHDIK
jgi:predicted secreted protein